MIQPFLLIAGILWVAISNPPRYLWNYLLAQGATTIVLYTTLVLYPVQSPQYNLAWMLCSVLLLYVIVRLTRRLLFFHPAKWLLIASAASWGVLLDFIAYRGLARPVSLANWMGIAAGAVLMACGVCLGCTAAYCEGRDRLIAMVLGILWILQSLWNYGFVLHDGALLDKLNYVAPTMLCLGAWGHLGMQLRKFHRDFLPYDK